MIRTVEINDNLDEIVESAIDDVKTELTNFLNENEPDSTPCLQNDLNYNGAIDEITDSAVPVYTNQIKGLWFLYENEFTEAYENAGIGDNPLENDGAAAIYFYIQEQINDWYSSNADDIFEAWQAARPAEEEQHTKVRY